MKRVFLFSALSTGFLLFASVVEAAPRSCRLVYPERPQGGPKTAYLFDGEKSHLVKLASMNFSEVVVLPKGALTISMTAAEVSDPELVPANAPQLEIPEEVTDFYIVVHRDPANEELPLKMEWIDASDGKLKKGETLWWNFTPDRIKAKLSGEEMTLEPMGQAVSKAPSAESGYYEASFSYQVDGEGELNPITEQSWWHDVNSKHLGLIIGSGGKLPKIFYFRDFRDPPVNGVLGENP